MEKWDPLQLDPLQFQQFQLGWSRSRRRSSGSRCAHQRKTKKKLAQAVSKGVAIAVGEPKMEIDAEAAGEVDANERLRPGFAQEAPPAIPLGMDRHGMEERLELCLAALLSSIRD